MATVPVIGQDVCACQPQSFTLSLNLDGECPSDTFSSAVGIDEVVCRVLDANDIPLTDAIPASVSTVIITEYDQTLDTIIDQEVYEGNFTSGDVFEFNGFVPDGGVVDSITGLPGGILVTLSGFDADGNVVDNSFVIDFSTDCGISGVIPDGQQVGWVIFVRDKTIDLGLF